MFLTQYRKVSNYLWWFYIFCNNHQFTYSSFNCFCNFVGTFLYFTTLMCDSYSLIDWANQVSGHLKLYVISLSQMYHPLGSFPFFLSFQLVLKVLGGRNIPTKLRKLRYFRKSKR